MYEQKRFWDKGHMKYIGIIGIGLLGSAVASRLLKRKILPSLESVETTILGAGGLIEAAPL